MKKQLREQTKKRRPIKAGPSSVNYYVHCKVREAVEKESIPLQMISEMRHRLTQDYHNLTLKEKQCEITKLTNCVEETAWREHEKQQAAVALETHNRIFPNMN